MSPDFQPSDPLGRFRASGPSRRAPIERAATAPLPRDFRPVSPRAPRGQGFTEPVGPRALSHTAATQVALKLEPRASTSSPSSGIRPRAEPSVTWPSVGTAPPQKPAAPSAASPSFPLYLTPVAGLLLASMGLAGWFFVSARPTAPRPTPAITIASAMPASSAAPPAASATSSASVPTIAASSVAPIAPTAPARAKPAPAGPTAPRPAPAPPKPAPARPAHSPDIF